MKLGIDLGGTKIEIIALDDLGVECLRRRVATPQGDYAATLHTIANQWGQTLLILIIADISKLNDRNTQPLYR